MGENERDSDGPWLASAKPPGPSAPPRLPDRTADHSIGRVRLRRPSVSSAARHARFPGSRGASSRSPTDLMTQQTTSTSKEDTSLQPQHRVSKEVEKRNGDRESSACSRCCVRRDGARTAPATNASSAEGEKIPGPNGCPSPDARAEIRQCRNDDPNERATEALEQNPTPGNVSARRDRWHRERGEALEIVPQDRNRRFGFL